MGDLNPLLGGGPNYKENHASFELSPQDRRSASPRIGGYFPFLADPGRPLAQKWISDLIAARPSWPAGREPRGRGFAPQTNPHHIRSRLPQRPSFRLIQSPAIVVCAFQRLTQREIIRTFDCLSGPFRAPQFFDKWTKIDASSDGWTEYCRHLDGTTSRTRYCMAALDGIALGDLKRRDNTSLDLLAGLSSGFARPPVCPPRLIEVRNETVALDGCRLKEGQQLFEGLSRFPYLLN